MNANQFQKELIGLFLLWSSAFLAYFRQVSWSAPGMYYVKTPLDWHSLERSVKAREALNLEVFKVLVFPSWSKRKLKIPFGAFESTEAEITNKGGLTTVWFERPIPDGRYERFNLFLNRSTRDAFLVVAFDTKEAKRHQVNEAKAHAHELQVVR